MIPAFAFVGLVFHSFVSVSSLVFWPQWTRVLMTSESSGSVGCVYWGLGDLRSLVLLCPTIKPMSSSAVVGQNMETRGGAAVWDC